MRHSPRPLPSCSHRRWGAVSFDQRWSVCWKRSSCWVRQPTMQHVQRMLQGRRMRDSPSRLQPCRWKWDEGRPMLVRAEPLSWMRVSMHWMGFAPPSLVRPMQPFVAPQVLRQREEQPKRRLLWARWRDQRLQQTHAMKWVLVRWRVALRHQRLQMMFWVQMVRHDELVALDQTLPSPVPQVQGPMRRICLGLPTPPMHFDWMRVPTCSFLF